MMLKIHRMKRSLTKGKKENEFSFGAPLTQAIRVFMKSSILAHKLDLKCSHAADVDLLGVEYL